VGWGLCPTLLQKVFAFISAYVSKISLLGRFCGRDFSCWSMDLRSEFIGFGHCCGNYVHEIVKHFFWSKILFKSVKSTYPMSKVSKFAKVVLSWIREWVKPICVSIFSLKEPVISRGGGVKKAHNHVSNLLQVMKAIVEKQGCQTNFTNMWKVIRRVKPSLIEPETEQFPSRITETTSHCVLIHASKSFMRQPRLRNRGCWHRINQNSRWVR
jgi:hypothetical protein